MLFLTPNEQFHSTEGQNWHIQEDYIFDVIGFIMWRIFSAMIMTSQ